MTRAVVLRRAAQREFDEAVLWYEERRVGLGAEFVAEIERAVGLAAENPERFPVMHRDVRCVRTRRFPYSVFFRIEPAGIVVLAVFHARRNPATWQRRA
jgi:plasmid stabilization system protein ParE